MTPTIAVIGANGAVGRDMLDILCEREFPAASISVLESGKAVGKEYSYGDDDVLRSVNGETFSWEGVTVALFLDDARKVPAMAARAAKAGCIAVDLTGALALEPGVPLIAMDVNPEDLSSSERKKMVACPSGASLVAATILAPIYDCFGLKRAVITSLHSTAERGRDGQDELFRQTRGIYVNQPPSETRELFPKQIAFNVIPQVGPFVEDGVEDGATSEEAALVAETRKMLDPDVRLHANCIQAPLFVGVSQFVAMECNGSVDVARTREILREAPGVSVIDHRAEEGYATPVEATGEDLVFVSRIRLDRSIENGLSLWCVGDTLRLQALNAVRIVEALLSAKA